MYVRLEDRKKKSISTKRILDHWLKLEAAEKSENYTSLVNASFIYFKHERMDITVKMKRELKGNRIISLPPLLGMLCCAHFPET